jgi:outer membrane protein assembly factor BamB
MILSFLVPFSVQAVSINERAGNNFRTAANNQEFTLNKDNVNAAQFGLQHTFDFDAKVETQPLVVEKGAGNDDLIIITTMKNQVIGINARTNAQVYKETLGDEISDANNMDMWRHTPTWGISATPIIDPSSNTLFVAAWMQKNKGDNRFRDYKIFALNPTDGKQKAPPVRIFGQSQEGNDCWFNDANAVNEKNEQFVYPKLRAGLALTANNGLVLAFAANGEQAQKGRANPHGFVVAYDTRGLLKQTGFSQEPAMFCTTAFDSWGGGIWQAGGAPVTDGDTIYVASSNGSSSNKGSDKADINLTESMIKLRFIPSNAGSRPVLDKLDFYKAFLDEHESDINKCLWRDNSSEVSCGRAALGKAGADWDFGPSGPVMFPNSQLLLQGTKDGIIYSLDKNNLGKHDRFNQLMSKPPLVASYFAGDVNQNWDRANRLNSSIPCPSLNDLDGDKGAFAWFQPCNHATPEGNKTHHIHALALAQLDPTHGIVFVWGENANLKAYNFSTTRDVFPTFRAEGDERASKGYKSPGGMPGGLLMVSSKPSTLPSNPHGIDADTAILWAIYPITGDANKEFAEGQLIAYDATTVLSGNKLKRLFRTGDDNQGELGKMTRMAPPVVANGRVYVMIYRVNGNTVVGSQLKVFGL